MKLALHLSVIGCLWVIFAVSAIAQENPGESVEESAEISTEAYSDTYQEHFFEALKQKAIGNYDRAAQSLLACKELDAKDDVVDYELATVLFATGDYAAAYPYSVAAVAARPQNEWYLASFMAIGPKLGLTWDQLRSEIPFKDPTLRKNLVNYFVAQDDFRSAQEVLSTIEDRDFVLEIEREISLGLTAQEMGEDPEDPKPGPSPQKESPIQVLKTRLATLLDQGDFTALIKESAEALEQYPLQPYFYYVQGYAFNREARYDEALEALHTGLDYLVDDAVLGKNLYTELANAYTAKGNTSKANTYLRMIEKGN